MTAIDTDSGATGRAKPDRADDHGPDHRDVLPSVLPAAITLLTASLDPPQSDSGELHDALRDSLPEDCAGLVELFAGMYGTAHLLLLELSRVTGEPAVAPLQRLAVLAADRTPPPSAVGELPGTTLAATPPDLPLPPYDSHSGWRSRGAG